MVVSVTGTVLRIYTVDQKDRQTGQILRDTRLDLYDGEELLKIRKLPPAVNFGVGEQVTLQVRLRVFNDNIYIDYDLPEAPPSSPRK